MKIGNKVRIVKCDVCPKVIGKIATIVGIVETEAGSPKLKKETVEVKFGKGRPQLNRPNTFACEDIALVEESVDG